MNKGGCSTRTPGEIVKTWGRAWILWWGKEGIRGQGPVPRPCLLWVPDWDFLQRLSVSRIVAAVGLHDSLLRPLTALKLWNHGSRASRRLPLARKGLFKRVRETGHVRGVFRALGKVMVKEKGMPEWLWWSALLLGGVLPTTEHAKRWTVPKWRRSTGAVLWRHRLDQAFHTTVSSALQARAAEGRDAR